MRNAALFTMVGIGVAWTCAAHADPADRAAESSVVVRALRDEVRRSTEGLSLSGSKRPYYVAYRLDDRRSLHLEADFGALTTRSSPLTRTLHADVRVGDWSLDSGNFGSDRRRWWREGARALPVEDSYDVVRRGAWLRADDEYKRALDAFDRKAGLRASRTEPIDRAGDFSPEPAVQLVDWTEPAAIEEARLIEIVEKVSAVGRSSPVIQSANARLSAMSGRRTFVSSEGTVVVEPRAALMLNLIMRTQADDGMKLARAHSWASCSTASLPSADELAAEARALTAELEEIRRAPLAEDYTGPVLFEGVAAPQLLRRAFDLSGTPPPIADQPSFDRERDSDLAGRVGQRILPAGTTLEDDPRADRVGSLPLLGCYRTDDEGVPAQKVTVVEDGVFKSFLMSRTPRKGFPRSNGHGRATWDGRIRGAIANLVLSSKNARSASDLRARLLREVRAAKLPYGIIVRELADYATMEREDRWKRESGTPALAMWKITSDGKETRVRGGRIEGVPLQAFKDILAVGDTPRVASEVYEHDSSVVSPPLLFKEVVVKAPREPGRKAPVAPRPDL